MWCGTAWAEAGQVLCKSCKKKRTESDKQKDPTGENKRERMRKLREERRALGLCIMCGRETDGVHAQCFICLKRGREREQVRRIRKRIERNEKAAVSARLSEQNNRA